MRTHTLSAPSHAVNDVYHPARAVQLHALLWCKQHRFEEAKSGALCAADALKKLGAVDDVDYTRKVLRWIDAQGNGRADYPW